MEKNKSNKNWDKFYFVIKSLYKLVKIVHVCLLIYWILKKK